jgi:hypothetical protein
MIKYILIILFIYTSLIFPSTRILIISLDMRPFYSDTYKSNYINTRVAEYEKDGYEVVSVDIIDSIMYIKLNKPD